MIVSSIMKTENEFMQMNEKADRDAMYVQILDCLASQSQDCLAAQGAVSRLKHLMQKLQPADAGSSSNHDDLHANSFEDCSLLVL
eukprot:scaffold1699_cov252-Ochromonas_danica.AAC.15